MHACKCPSQLMCDCQNCTVLLSCAYLPQTHVTCYMTHMSHDYMIQFTPQPTPYLLSFCCSVFLSVVLSFSLCAFRFVCLFFVVSFCSVLAVLFSCCSRLFVLSFLFVVISCIVCRSFCRYVFMCFVRSFFLSFVCSPIISGLVAKN